MAITFGGLSTVDNASSVTSVSVSGSNAVGVVVVQGATGGEGDLITGATWNGVTMTLIGKVTGTRWRYIFAISNPPAGTSTIAFSGTSDYWRVYSLYYTGAQLPKDSSATNTGTNGDLDLSTLVVATDCWLIVGFGNHQTAATFSAGSGVFRANSDAGAVDVWDSNGTVSTGSQGVSITSTAAGATSGVIFSLAPYTATNVTVTPAVLSATFSVPAATISNATPVTVTPAVQAASFSIPAATVTAATNITVAAAVLALLFSTSVGSGSDGPNSPGTMADDAAVGTLSWASPDNAKISEGSYTTASNGTLGGTTHYLKATNFGFSIPSTATIDGIKVEIERWKSSGGSNTANAVRDNIIHIVKADASYGATDKADTTTNWPTGADAYATYGSSSELWGETWTAADINDVDFGVGISASLIVDVATPIAAIDHIRITVYYTGSGVTVSTTSNATITPSALSVVASIPSPTVNFDCTVTPSVQVATFSIPAVTVLSDTSVEVTPSVVSAVFGVQSPAVNLDYVVSISVAAASFSTPSPAVSASATIATSPLVASLSVLAPTVTATTIATVTPTVLSASFSIAAPSIALDYAVMPSVLNATFSTPAVTIVGQGSVIAQPTVLDATFSLPSPSVALDFTVAALTQAATFSVQSPAVVINQDATISASVFALTASLPSTSVVTQTAVSPSVLSATFSVQAPSFAFDYVVAIADPVAAVFSLLTPTRIGGLWTNESRPSTAWDNETRATTVLTNEARRSTSWTNEPRPEI